MWSFGHRVRIVERSEHQVIIEESATTGAVVIFGAFALLPLFISKSFSAGLVVALLFAGASLYASITSKFVGDHSRRALIVHRRIGWFRYEAKYPAEEIERVYVRRTIKGNGLAVRFNSGKTKSLTTSLDYAPGCDDLADALNHVLHTAP